MSLIAAAPKTLAAFKELVGAIQKHAIEGWAWPPGFSVERARAAIAEAEMLTS